MNKKKNPFILFQHIYFHTFNKNIFISMRVLFLKNLVN